MDKQTCPEHSAPQKEKNQPPTPPKSWEEEFDEKFLYNGEPKVEEAYERLAYDQAEVIKSFIHEVENRAEERGKAKAAEDWKFGGWHKAWTAGYEAKNPSLIAAFRKTEEQARTSLLKELEEEIRGMVPAFQKDESQYPDARWQRENFAAKKEAKVLINVLSLLHNKATQQ